MSARGGTLLVAAGLAAGALFFASVPRLWPLAATDLSPPRGEVVRQAERFLVERGFDLGGYRSSAMLTVAGPALDHLERAGGTERAQQWIAAGLPLVYQRVELKRRGEAVTYSVNVHATAGVIGWSKVLPEDYPGERLPVERARELAQAALRTGLGLDPASFVEQSWSSSEQPARRTHEFVLERPLDGAAGARERVTLTVAGAQVTRAVRWLRVPDEAERAAVAAEAPAIALETVGFVLLACGAIAGFFVFLGALRAGAVRLGRAAVWPAAVFACMVGTWALETPRLFRNWEPLWPLWVSNLRYLAFAALEQSWLLLVLLAVIAAGQATDDRLGAGRGAALAALARGRLLDPAVVRASGRGFLVGLLCGGTLAAGVLAVGALTGATISIQPRGFFFYPLNSAAPAVTTLLFFFGVALAEELGYRFFAGSWLLALTGRAWVAVVVPALVYGLSHARLDFLPPAEPFWGRPLVLTLVGCVWGLALLRYDALTVVLSHYTADLFIFSWPRLASGRPWPVFAAVLVVSVPLLPALLAAPHRVVRSLSVRSR